jgi:DNA-binding FadR family transcriptional regulator
MYDKDLKPVNRPPSLTESVQQVIRDFISENQLKSGDALTPETQLTKQLGVSRNAIREAVKALEMTGIIEVRRGSGLFVGDFSLDPLLESLPFGLMNDLRDLRELLEIRMVLEVGMVEQVIEKCTEKQITGLRATLESMGKQANAGKPFPEEDREFHKVLFKNINNQTLLKLLDIFWKAYNSASQFDDIEDYDPMKTYRDHVSILDAVEAGDVDAAKTALANHYTGLGSLKFRIDRVEKGHKPEADERDEA